MSSRKVFITHKLRALSRRAITISVLLGIAAIVIAGAFLFRVTAHRPERSQSSFCTYLTSNKMPHDWKASADYYKELEQRAPDDIRKQTKAIGQAYEQMNKHPQDAVGLDLSLADTGSQFNAWVNKNCSSDGSTDPRQMLQQWSKDVQSSQEQN